MKKSIFKRSLAIMMVLLMAVAFIPLNASATDVAPNGFAMMRQTDSQWNNVYFNGGSLTATGCGIFSFVNAVGYLTGYQLDVVEVASWAHNNGMFNVYGADGTYRTSFYPRANTKYGPTYGFSIDCSSDGSGYWSDSYDSTLRNHIMNGGVAVAHVYNHFIAIVGYNASTDSYHIWDCAPRDRRGTLYSNGNNWFTRAHLASATYMTIDWFCLFSSNGTRNHQLDGNDPVDMGADFYARISNPATNKYFTDENREVWARDFNGEATQVWHFMRQASGAYLVGNASSAKFLSVKDGIYRDGSRLVTSDVTFDSEQKFYIFYLYGNFYFMPEGRDMTVDVDGSLFHTQICGTSTEKDKSEASFKARSFNLEILNIYDGTRNSAELGDSFTATIKNSASGKFVTASGNTLVGANESKADNQKWNFTKLPNGAYTIVSASENLAIDVYNTLIEEGTSVDLFDLHGGNAQTFFLVEKDGTYYIKSTYTLNALHMDAAKLDFYANTTGDDATKVAAQKFEIKIVGNTDSSLVLKDSSSYSEDGSMLLKVVSGQKEADVLGNFENENAVILDADGKEVPTNAKVGTGYSVALVIDGKTVDSLDIVICGDVSGEGVVDGTDYLRIKNIFLETLSVEGVYYKAADVDGNGIVDSTDYMRVKSHFVGSYNLFA